VTEAVSEAKLRELTGRNPSQLLPHLSRDSFVGILPGMFGDGSLAFSRIRDEEPLPLAGIHDAC